MDSLDDFAKWLVDQQAVPPDLDPKVRAQLEADLREGANDLINRRTVESMDSVTLERFNNLLDSDAEPEALARFVERNIPNKEQIVAEALIEFRKSYLGR